MILLAAALMLDGTIEELLRALRDDAVERRQEAVDALTLLGEAGLDAIREARPGADAEMRARLAEIEAGIEADVRRRGFPGGPEVLGLKAALTALWDPERDAMTFRLTIMNVDGRPRPLVEPTGWDVEIPRWSSGFGGNRMKLEIRAVRVDPDGLTWGGGSYGSIGCRRRAGPLPTDRLAPGEARTAEPLLLGRGSDPQNLELRPGVYEARAQYFARKLLPDATADLETPWVPFTVPN